MEHFDGKPKNLILLIKDLKHYLKMYLILIFKHSQVVFKQKRGVGFLKFIFRCYHKEVRFKKLNQSKTTSRTSHHFR